jgi:Zn-finger nucleic acid-binding protein
MRHMTKVLLCPICANMLHAESRELLDCPKGHGALITGGHLSNLREKPKPANAPKTSTVINTEHAIECPHCTHAMHKVNYNGTGIMIDACAHCHYRWLDAGEAHKIQHFKPSHSPEDLLFIAEIDRKIQAHPKRDPKEANPELPHRGWWYRLGNAALSPGRAPAGILGQGLYGIVHGLVHSKTSRYLVIATIIIFTVLFMFVANDYRDFLDSWDVYNLKQQR